MAHTLETVGDILISKNPLQRIGKPEEVGGTAVFLASRAAAWINGATITLDGGSIVAMSTMKGIAKL